MLYFLDVSSFSSQLLFTKILTYMSSGLLELCSGLLVPSLFLRFHLQTSSQPKSMREGNEPETFWDLLGEKSEYPKEKEMRKQIEEPHLFTCSYSSGNSKHLFAFAFYHLVLLFSSAMVQL